MTIKRWIEFNTGGSLGANQTLATTFISALNTLLGYPSTPQKTTAYGVNFTYNTNYARVEILDNVYPLLSGSDQAKCFEDFPNLITLTSPVNNQAYQRNGSDQADILITGTYRGINSGPLEASFNGGAYTSVNGGNPLTGGSFSFSLPAQAGGQGTFSIRPVSDPLAVVSKTNVLITDVFLVAGQSNHGEQATNAKTSTGNSVVWNKATRRGTWSNMNGTDGTTQAYWPLLANSFATSQGRQCAFIEVALGGTSAADWQSNSSYAYVDIANIDPYGSGLGWNLMTRALNAIRDSHCGGVKGILWHQGEADAIALANGTTFQNQTQTIADYFYAQTGAQMGAAKLEQILADAAPHLNVSVTAVNTAIGNLWGAGGNVWTGPDFSDLTPATYETGYGNIHLKTDSEVSAQASRWWTAIKAKYGYA